MWVCCTCFGLCNSALQVTDLMQSLAFHKNIMTMHIRARLLPSPLVGHSTGSAEDTATHEDLGSTHPVHDRTATTSLHKRTTARHWSHAVEATSTARTSQYGSEFVLVNSFLLCLMRPPLQQSLLLCHQLDGDHTLSSTDNHCSRFRVTVDRRHKHQMSLADRGQEACMPIALYAAAPVHSTTTDFTAGAAAGRPRNTVSPLQPVRRAQGAAAGAQAARAQAPGTRPARGRASCDCCAGAPRHRRIRPGHTGSVSCACAHRRLPMRAVVCLHSAPTRTLVTCVRPAWLSSCALGTQRSSTLLSTPQAKDQHSA